ncbi:hypothetical protein SD457_09320 [Coprobacillaceae bacterium CR2/5/TPMF4]|nr:hypothetical protein SD457_09320 [Coprobacillaceae bacterium CR2/5/TPMF4]
MSLPDDLIPTGIIVLSDIIREDAKETLAYFYDQGVDLKLSLEMIQLQFHQSLNELD